MMHAFGSTRATRLALAALVPILTACEPAAEAADAPVREARSRIALDLDAAGVRLPALADSTVTLRNGVSDDPARGRWVSRVEGIEAEADFDGDGESERAVLVTANTGGSPVILNIVAYGQGDNGPEQRAVLQLGDLIQLHRFEAHGDTLVVELTGGSGAQASADGRYTRRLRIEGPSWVDVSVAN